MRKLSITTSWLAKLLPEGYPVGGSTLISGPGGSGKPLIGNVIAADWLRSGGSVAFLTLQYPDRSFLYAAFDGAAEEHLEAYTDRIRFVSLDPQANRLEEVDELGAAACLARPDQWRAAMDYIDRSLPQEGPGILVFAAALNLLFFSPSYGEAILKEMLDTMRDPRFSVLFSASTRPMEEQVKKLEQAADNLIMSHKPEEVFELFMRIERMKGVSFSHEEIRIPIPASELSSMREVAEHSRTRVIPELSRL
jgi:KaiC/GvpD/RAD55 family RecA-like ATPase